MHRDGRHLSLVYVFCFTFRYKQQNSHANRMDRSIVLNFWFKHLHDHEPVSCDMPDEEATCDKFEYSDIKMQEENPMLTNPNPNMEQQVEGEDMEVDTHLL